jgi:hypothetical protein
VSTCGSGDIVVGAAIRRQVRSHLTHCVIGCVGRFGQKIDGVGVGVRDRVEGNRDIGECVVINRVLLPLEELYGGYGKHTIGKTGGCRLYFSPH